MTPEELAEIQEALDALESVRRAERAQEQAEQLSQQAKALFVQDYAAVRRLASIKKQTKVQLLSKGLSSVKIADLCKRGILSRQYDAQTNLYYYSVSDSFASELCKLEAGRK